MPSPRPASAVPIAAAQPSTARYKVVCGDAFDLLDTLDDDSVDLIVTSPPYWGLRTYGLDHDAGVLETWQRRAEGPDRPPGYEWYRSHGGVLGLEPYPEWYVAHLAEVFNKAAPKLQRTGSMWVNLGDTYFARWSSIRPDGRQGIGESVRLRRRTPAGGVRHDKQLLLLPARWAIAMQEHGWVLRNDLIWHKPDVAPRPEADRLRLAHEHFFHLVRRAPRGRPQYFYELDRAEREAHDVVSVATSRAGDGHSATFPAELVTPRIESSSPPSGLVLDPFCGVGTTLTSAARLGRRTLGFDISEHYATIARDKLRTIADAA